MGVPAPEPEPVVPVAEVVKVVVDLEVVTAVVLGRLDVVEAGVEVDAAVLLGAAEDVAAPG